MNHPLRARRLAVTTAIVAVAMSGLVAAPAPAAPTWRPATVLSGPSVHARYSAVAVDAAGTSTAVWITNLEGQDVVQAATRPAGHTWSAPQTLASEAWEVAPDLAVDAAGNATAVWVHEGEDKFWVQASQRPAGGSWTEAVDISPPADYVEPPRVGTDANGTATVVWSEFQNPTEAIYVASMATGQAWTEPEPLSGDEVLVNSSPEIAVNASGEAVVGWSSTSFGYRSVLRSGAGLWGAVETLPGATTGERRVDVAISDAGVASYAWNYRGAVVDNLNVAIADHVRGGTWSAPHPFCSTTIYCTYPRIEVNEAGDAALLWLSRNVVGGTDVLVSTRTAGGAWSDTHTLGQDVAFARDQRVVLDESGTATAFWTSGDDAQPVVFARHSRHGAWSVPAPFTDPDIDAWEPAVAVSPTGDITATWSSDRTTILAAGLDVAGPRLDGFSAPATATAGQNITYSAFATDVWSPVTSYSWSFGDGGTATGAVVTHTYAAAGSYPVTLTVTDEVGNTTTRTATTTITIAAPTPPPAGKQAPVITVFKLTDPKIQALARAAVDTPDKTKLKVRLTTAAKVRLVVKSAHRHLVNGQHKRVKVVLTRRLPAGTGVIVLRGRLATIKLPADTYTIVGTATNLVGTSPARKVRLKVVHP